MFSEAKLLTAVSLRIASAFAWHAIPCGPMLFVWLDGFRTDRKQTVPSTTTQPVVLVSGKSMGGA
jgi:hypothetical protein